MILKLNFVNPITNKDDNLILEYPDIDNNNYSKYQKFDNEDDVIYHIYYLIGKITANSQSVINNKLLCPVNSFMYNNYLSDLYYYLLQIKNPIKYNDVIAKIINCHKCNVIFQNEFNCNKVEQSVPKKKSKKIPNKFFRAVSRNIFTGDTIYVYKNPKTEEIIESKDPNLLDELNSKKKVTKTKTKKAKGYSVPLKNITFSFKKK